jgi:hypothetical protein
MLYKRLLKLKEDIQSITNLEATHWYLCSLEGTLSVATPLWGKCEVAIHTPENGTWKSFRTLENSEFDCKGQNTLPLRCCLYCWKGLQVEMSKMASHESFGHLQHKLWSKERSEVKLAVWLPTIKSQESTRLRCVQAECDTSLESSQRELQVCFRPHRDRRAEQGIMSYQSPGSPNWDSFGTPTWESWDKQPFGCGPVEWCRVYYMGEGGGFH